MRNEWDKETNGNMKKFVNGRKQVNWICSKDNHHKWSSRINSRTNKLSTGCPICKNKKICPINAIHYITYI